MASIPITQPDPGIRATFLDKGGECASRCFQCATCSSVCELAPAEAPFPRRQVLWAQWGLFDKLAADPGAWLCHQCNDCSVRCPRDVGPGDVMAAIRAMMVERLAFPAALGKLVGNVKATWPLLVFGPILFWLVLLFATTGLGEVPVHHHLQPSATMGQFFYDQYVPHYLIYAVYFSATGWILLALGSSGFRFWKELGSGAERKGSFIGALIGTCVEIATHGKFSSCERGIPKRRWGHFMVMWGFIGAAITSGFAVVYLYGDTPLFSWFFKILPFETPGYPVPISHWVKWLGNASAIALVLGGILLFINRLSTGNKLVGATTAFDRFFLWVVLAVIGTGVLTEIFRFVPGVSPMLGLGVYILHLGVVLSLFLTLPYSKFAHLVYRTLAITHQRMADAK